MAFYLHSMRETKHGEMRTENKNTPSKSFCQNFIYLLIAKATQEIAVHGQLVTKVTDPLGHTFQFQSALKWLDTIFSCE